MASNEAIFSISFDHMITKLKRLIQRVVRRTPDLPHVCTYKCIGTSPHFGQICDVVDTIINPTWYHFPSMDVRRSWLKNDKIETVRVYQSHWQCTCGKKEVYFFVLPVGQTVSLDDMERHHPMTLNCSRGRTLNEVCDELISDVANR